MNKSMLKYNTMLMLINNLLIKLPTPINISIWWNIGSLLGIMLTTQIMTGLLISMHYCTNTNYAFNSMIHIIQDVNMGWLLRIMHMNGASIFFLCMFFHIGRGIYYGSYNLMMPWFIGTMIFLTSMSTAFMGYVLPWGQMSFWGATVITNLISTIPYIGQMLVEWIWGGFSVSNPTLNRFFSLHFMLPFIIYMMMMFHLMYIHKTGSNNPMGLNSNLNKIPFKPYFIIKDLMGFIIIMFILIWLCLTNPFMLADPENFMMANSMITPMHIQPEWYFLFAYSILRSIPNKLGGVIALIMSILILLIMPFMSFNKMQSMKFYPMNQIMFWIFINIMLILTWLGTKPIEEPFIKISYLMTWLYFLFYLVNSLTLLIWDFFLFK